MEYRYKICLLRDIMHIIVNVRFNKCRFFHKTLCFLILKTTSFTYATNNIPLKLPAKHHNRFSIDILLLFEQREQGQFIIQRNFLFDHHNLKTFCDLSPIFKVVLKLQSQTEISFGLMNHNSIKKQVRQN